MARLNVCALPSRTRRAVTRSYYRGAVGALVVFDVTDRDTFLHLPSWLSDARTLAWSDVSIFIVGNKVDDEENREVTMLEAASFAQENSCVADRVGLQIKCLVANQVSGCKSSVSHRLPRCSHRCWLH